MGANASILESAISDNDEPCLHIFGYGSLIWNPGFAFDQQYRVVVKGYARKFYQGNITFRGTEELPGRCVTLVENQNSLAYGLIFRVTGRRRVLAAVDHLYKREVENGYKFEVVNAQSLETGLVCRALTCIAYDDNEFFLGPPQTTLSECEEDVQVEVVRRKMAREIATARGTAGPNYEYLFKLADWMRKLFPHVIDEDLYQLEVYVMSYLE